MSGPSTRRPAKPKPEPPRHMEIGPRLADELDLTATLAAIRLAYEACPYPVFYPEKPQPEIREGRELWRRWHETAMDEIDAGVVLARTRPVATPGIGMTYAPPDPKRDAAVAQRLTGRRGPARAAEASPASPEAGEVAAGAGGDNPVPAAQEPPEEKT